MHNCHIKKWRASWLAYLWESEYYNQGTVYRAEYQLQYVGNNGSNIAKFEPDGSHRCSHCNIQKTICTLVRTWWTNARLKVTVSYIAWLPVMRCGVTTTSWSQNGSLWNGDVSFPSKKKFKMQPSGGEVMCTVFCGSKGVILLDFLEPRQTMNSDCSIAMMTELKASTSGVRSEKMTNFLLQCSNARPHTSLKITVCIANIGWTVLPHPW